MSAYLLAWMRVHTVYSQYQSNKTQDPLGAVVNQIHSWVQLCAREHQMEHGRASSVARTSGNPSKLRVPIHHDAFRAFSINSRRAASNFNGYLGDDFDPLMACSYVAQLVHIGITKCMAYDLTSDRSTSQARSCLTFIREFGMAGSNGSTSPLSDAELLNSVICSVLWEGANSTSANTSALLDSLLTRCVGTVLAANRDTFWVVYCNNPPDDNCPYGYCPNGDIAAYIVSFATGTPIGIPRGARTHSKSIAACLMNMSDDTSHIIWAQLLTLYSLLVLGFVALAGNQLGRIHAELALLIVGSPLTCFLWGQSFWTLLRPRRTRWTASKIARHVLISVSFFLYLAFIIITLIPKASSFFTQESCYREGLGAFGLPFFLLNEVSIILFSVELSSLVVLVIIEWINRRDAWLDMQDGRFLSVVNVKRFLRLMRAKYNHTFFVAFTGVPFIAWVWITELTAISKGGIPLGSPVAFGQLLTLFAAVPPVLAIFQVASGRQAKRRLMQRNAGIPRKGSAEDLLENARLGEKSDPETLHADLAGMDVKTGFVQWWKDLFQAAATDWMWLVFAASIAGFAGASVVLGPLEQNAVEG
ncbi:hypothetical protein GLOTRDRAFT_123084 [Gloeophyllum trabeum ATCC 11539]|uniref:Uncharacterized protein n=1 Tax=Gloeophyllum trabeum (strain ATCC 11539 / FP-39264 / Madison 617) TaxID=670483 RepID=S7RFZ3_GLOTA|nr:uncharacterized protein GLOTRDRAFT_123084 [Gloeophyllum trabeum ATCC 11539]EPQ51439.1 hypothetical protein GLOTRDRAFT_123084 [Gloeophyllum trabeum ATCC 11539]